MKQDIVVLAAGKGSRMKSHISKVLHPIGGQAMVRHVLNTATKLIKPDSDQSPSSQSQTSRLHLIVGHQGQSVADHCQDFQANVVWQDNPQGTGDALRRVADDLDPQGATLTLYGDVPLIRASTLAKMQALANDNTLVLLTVVLDNPTGYGRIVRDHGRTLSPVVAIVEHKDATPEQHAIKEVNTGILLAPNHRLKDWLAHLSNDNAQGEYYLTDIIAMAAQEEMSIATVHPEDEAEVMGVNDKVQLSWLERQYQQQQAAQLMRDGLTLLDPARFDLRGNLSMGMDCVIDINCIIEGDVVLGDGVTIGPNCHLKNCVIGSQSVIKNNSMIEDSRIDQACDIGPFARLRPGTQLAANAKIGNFVETKKTMVGKGSKINHLSYVGDTIMGEGVNVGAGTITCNYDGVNKFQTQIGDGVFVGSNSSLVAPVSIEQGATIAAGSTITKTVQADQLAFARARQTNKDGWAKPKKK